MQASNSSLNEGMDSSPDGKKRQGAKHKQDVLVLSTRPNKMKKKARNTNVTEFPLTCMETWSEFQKKYCDPANKDARSPLEVVQRLGSMSIAEDKNQQLFAPIDEEDSERQLFIPKSPPGIARDLLIAYAEVRDPRATVVEVFDSEERKKLLSFTFKHSSAKHKEKHRVVEHQDLKEYGGNELINRFKNCFGLSEDIVVEYDYKRAPEEKHASKLSKQELQAIVAKTQNEKFLKRLSYLFNTNEQTSYSSLKWDHNGTAYDLKLQYSQNVPFRDSVDDQKIDATTSWIYDKELLLQRLGREEKDFTIHELTIYHQDKVAMKAWYAVPVGGGDPIFSELRDINQTKVKMLGGTKVMSGTATLDLFATTLHFFRPPVTEYLDESRLTDEGRNFRIPLRPGLDRPLGEEELTFYCRNLLDFDVSLKTGSWPTFFNETLVQDAKENSAAKRKLKEFPVKTMLDMFAQRAKELPAFLKQEEKFLKTELGKFDKELNLANVFDEYLLMNNSIEDKLAALADQEESSAIAELYARYHRYELYQYEFTKQDTLLKLVNKAFANAEGIAVIPDDLMLGQLYQKISEKARGKKGEDKDAAKENKLVKRKKYPASLPEEMIDLAELNKLIWDGISTKHNTKDYGVRKVFPAGSVLAKFADIAQEALWGGYLYQIKFKPKQQSLEMDTDTGHGSMPLT